MWNIKQHKIAWLIAGSCLALIALIAFQVKWMQQSRDLLEEQFDQKVSMALCSAVENMSTTEEVAEVRSTCTAEPKPPSCAQKIDELLESPSFDQKISTAFDFYDIGMDFEADIVDKSCVPADSISPYCCSMEPVLESESHLLTVDFPTKQDYVLEKMGFMVLSSILILLFVSIIFLLANYMLLRQRRMTEFNIDFFNNMAHEFRTPLTNIALATKLLAKNEKVLKDDKFLGIIKTESQHLMQQVERVLYLAKLENGDYQLEPQRINLSALINDVLRCMDLRLKEKGIQIRLEVQAEDAYIMGDALHLSNAFRNLIDNAIKYATTNAPILRIRLDKRDKHYHLLFEDNGQGISKKEQEFIFDKFHRSTNHQTEKGFGIGLAYVKMIIDKHKGKIRVWSELRKGTRFDLFLPKTISV